MDEIAETTGAIVADAVADAVSTVESAVVAAEARAEAAEEAAEAIADSVRRDALHDEIEAIREDVEEWHANTRSELEALQARTVTLETQMMEAISKMAEMAANNSTVSTVSIQQPSQAGAEPTPAQEPTVTVTTVQPGNASPAPMPESPGVRANQRRWI